MSPVIDPPTPPIIADITRTPEPVVTTFITVSAYSGVAKHAANGGDYVIFESATDKGYRLGCSRSNSLYRASVIHVTFTLPGVQSFHTQDVTLHVKLFFEAGAPGINLALAEDTVYRKANMFLEYAEYQPTIGTANVVWDRDYSGWMDVIFTIPLQTLRRIGTFTIYDADMWTRNVQGTGGIFLKDVVFNYWRPSVLYDLASSSYGFTYILKRRLIQAICIKDCDGPAYEALYFGLLTGMPEISANGTELPFTKGYERTLLPTCEFSHNLGITFPPTALPVPESKWDLTPWWAVYDAKEDGNMLFYGTFDDAFTLYKNDEATLTADSFFRGPEVFSEIHDAIMHLLWTRDKDTIAEYFVGADSPTREFDIYLYDADGNEIGPFDTPRPKATFIEIFSIVYGDPPPGGGSGVIVYDAGLALNEFLIRLGTASDGAIAPASIGFRYAGKDRFVVPLDVTGVCEPGMEFAIAAGGIRLQV